MTADEERFVEIAGRVQARRFEALDALEVFTPDSANPDLSETNHFIHGWIKTTRQTLAPEAKGNAVFVEPPSFGSTWRV